MRALIIATGYKSTLASLLNKRPTPLLCVVAKPIIFHILDLLSSFKIKQCDLILSYYPHMIEEKVGSGQRWGLDIRYHLVRDPDQPCAILKAIAKKYGDENILLACGDQLPIIHSLAAAVLPTWPLIWLYPDGRWSGWGVVPASLLRTLNNADPLTKIPELLTPQGKSIYTLSCIETDSFFDLKASNMRFLDDKYSMGLFPATAHCRGEKLWISQGALIHPSATLEAPAFIGRNTQIKANAHIGPYAVIEQNCVIDSRSRVSNALVLQRSYVGEDLKVEDSIVDHNLLINLSLKAEVVIRDDFILCELSPPSLLKWPLELLERGIAVLLFVLLFPLYLYMKLRHKEVKTPRLALPAKSNPLEWQFFDMRLFENASIDLSKSHGQGLQKLPTLLNIIRGEMHFMGVAPRTAEEVLNLPPEWKKLYLQSKVGLITLANVDSGSAPNEDEGYAAEVYYTVTMSFLSDIRLLCRWLKKQISGRNHPHEK